MAKSQSFEKMMGDLETILGRLSDENTPLEESLKLYAEAADRIAACSAVLADAKVRVEEISEKIDRVRENDAGGKGQ